jgi:hypothetical protein
VEYEQIADGNTEAYFTLLTLAEGTVLLNGVKALVAKVGGAEALKIIAKETAMSIKDAGAFVNDLVRGRGFGNVRAIGRLKVNKLAEANITNSGKTVLGKHIEGGGYIKKAQDTGSSYFDNGNKWDKLSPKQRWNANKHFLDKISAKGDEINLSTPKGKIIKGKYLDKEINYLINQKGYRWIDELTLKKL